MTTPGYQGTSQAIHVQEDGPSVAIEATPPPMSAPGYVGSKAIQVVSTSPDGFDLDTIRGPIYHNPALHGRSQAIHVFGAAGFRNPEVVPSCECADPVIGPYTCATCSLLHQNNRHANAITGTSWGTNTSFLRYSYITDSGGAPAGFAYDEHQTGPSFSRLSTGTTGAIGDTIRVGFPIFFRFPGDPWTIAEYDDRVYVSFAVDPTALAVRIVGDVYLDTEWSGSGQAEARALLPPTPFELVVVAYDTADIRAYDDGGQSSLDLTAYPQSVVMSGVHPGGYNVPFHVDAAVNFDVSGLSHVAFFIRNLATQTVGYFQSPNEALLFGRYPSYPPRDGLVAGGHRVLLSTYTVEFCTCPVIEGVVTLPHVVDDFFRSGSSPDIASSGQRWELDSAFSHDYHVEVHPFVTAPYGRVTPALPSEAIGQLYVESRSATDTARAAWNLPSGGDEWWEEAHGFTMTGVLSAYNVPSTFLHSTVEITLVDALGVSHGDMRINMDTRRGGESGAAEPGSLGVEGRTVEKVDWLTQNAGAAYWWKWQRVGGPSGLSRLKVWVVETDEPTDWGITIRASDVALPLVVAGGSLRLRVDPGSSPSPYDDFDAVTIYRIALEPEADSCSECSCVDGEIADYFCLTCTTLTDINRSRGPTGASWDSFSFIKSSTVDDSLTGPSFGESQSGPTFQRISSSSSGSLNDQFFSTFGHHGGGPWTVGEEGSRDYIAFAVDPTAPALHVVGDLYIDTSFGSGGDMGWRDILPPTPFELVAVGYNTANLAALNGGLQAAFDLDAYPKHVVASGTHPGTFGVPYHIDSAINIDLSGLTYIALFIRNLATQTVGSLSSAASVPILFDRYPGYPSDQLFIGGHVLTMPSYTIEFCTCPVDTGGRDCGSSVPFVANFLPTFRYQIGDPTTRLDKYICTMESGAMVLDWQTRGGVSVWGGELIPYCGRTEEQIQTIPGTNLGNVKTAWLHWNQHFEIRSGQTWEDLQTCLAQGRAVVLQGDYGVLPDDAKCQLSFEGNHAICLLPFSVGTKILTGDPLCHAFHGRESSDLQAYAEALGAATYGAQSPQPILFGVSSPWVK